MMATNYSSGHEAENVAAEFMQSRGFEIIELNWQTPVCEIDIIANKNKIVYFVEVKYRINDNQGGGFDYITAKKLQQMQFAAECWVQENKYLGDYELSALEMSADYQVTSFIQELT